MKTKPRNLWLFRKGDFDNDQFNEDLEVVAAYYTTLGFKDIKVGDHDITYDESGENMFITVNIVEGPVYTFGDVSWEGNEIYTIA